MQRKILPAIAVLLTAAAIGTSGASVLAKNDALADAGHKVSLAQGIAVAEQHLGGKATHAEYERHDGRTVIDVEIVKHAAVMDAKIDADSGSLIGVRADKADRDDHGESED